MIWLKAIHLAALMGWAGGLIGLSRLLASRPPMEDPGYEPVTAVGRRLYLGLMAPAAFLALLTGFWMLHKQPALLRQPWMHAKLTAVVALFVVDHLCMRGLKKPRSPKLYLGAHGVAVLAVLAAVILVVIRPWTRAVG